MSRLPRAQRKAEIDQHHGRSRLMIGQANNLATFFISSLLLDLPVGLSQAPCRPDFSHDNTYLLAFQLLRRAIYANHKQIAYGDDCQTVPDSCVMKIHLAKPSLAGSWWHRQNLKGLNKIKQPGRHGFALLVHWEVKHNFRSLLVSDGTFFAQTCHLSFPIESPFERIFRPRGLNENTSSRHNTI